MCLVVTSHSAKDERGAAIDTVAAVLRLVEEGAAPCLRTLWDEVSARLDDSRPDVRIAAARALSLLLPAVKAAVAAETGGEGGVDASVSLREVVHTALTRQSSDETNQDFLVGWI